MSIQKIICVFVATNMAILGLGVSTANAFAVQTRINQGSIVPAYQIDAEMYPDNKIALKVCEIKNPTNCQNRLVGGRLLSYPEYKMMIKGFHQELERQDILAVLGVGCGSGAVAGSTVGLTIGALSLLTTAPVTVPVAVFVGCSVGAGLAAFTKIEMIAYNKTLADSIEKGLEIKSSNQVVPLDIDSVVQLLERHIPVSDHYKSP